LTLRRPWEKRGHWSQSYADAPEIDGVVKLLPPEKISKTLKVGEFTKARIVANTRARSCGAAILKNICNRFGTKKSH
jgi:hypothetical protein